MTKLLNTKKCFFSDKPRKTKKSPPGSQEVYIPVNKMETAPDYASLRTTEGYLRLLLISNIFCYPHFLLSTACCQDYLILKPLFLLSSLRGIHFVFLIIFSKGRCVCTLYEGFIVIAFFLYLPFVTIVYILFLYLPIYTLVS